MRIHLPALSAIVYLLLIVYVAAQENSKGNRLLLFLLITSFFWPTLYYLEIIVDSLDTMIWISRVRIAAIPLVPFALFHMLVNLVGKEKSVPQWAWYGLWLAMLLLAVLSMTTAHHNLFMYDYRIELRYGRNFLVTSLGPAYWLYVIYNYTVSLCNFVLLVTWFREASYLGRRQAVLLMIASMGPLSLDIVRMLGIDLLPGVNLAPATLSLSGALIVWAVVGYRLAQASPVARAVLLDNLPSIVVVLDEMNRIVSVNRRAGEAMGRTRQELPGITPESLEAPWSNWLRPEWSPDPASGLRLEVKIGEEWRCFERSVHRLLHRRRFIGHMIYLDDVTTIHKASLAMAEHSRLQEQQMLLKDLHDGVGGIAAQIGLQAQLALVDEDEEKRQANVLGIMGLAQEMGVEVRRFISMLEQPDYGWNDWMLEIRTFCRTALNGLPIQLHFQIGDDQSNQSLRSDVGLSVYRMIKECVTNVIKHAQASDVWVTVELQQDHLVVEVRDNGKGFQGQPQRQGGLMNMRERVRKLGGKLNVISEGGVTQRTLIPAHRLWRQSGSDTDPQEQS